MASFSYCKRYNGGKKNREQQRPTSQASLLDGMSHLLVVHDFMIKLQNYYLRRAGPDRKRPQNVVQIATSYKVRYRVSGMI